MSTHPAHTAKPPVRTASTLVVFSTALALVGCASESAPAQTSAAEPLATSTSTSIASPEAPNATREPLSLDVCLQGSWQLDRNDLAEYYATFSQQLDDVSIVADGAAVLQFDGDRYIWLPDYSLAIQMPGGISAEATAGGTGGGTFTLDEAADTVTFAGASGNGYIFEAVVNGVQVPSEQLGAIAGGMLPVGEFYTSPVFCTADRITLRFMTGDGYVDLEFDAL